MSDNNGDRLKISDYYKAAVDLHNQEFRTLGERANAFLITQSILVAAFVYIVKSQNLVGREFIAWGIILAGIWLCLVYCLAGSSGSQAAFRWRQYMLSLEKQDGPWGWFYARYHHKYNGKGIRHFLLQFCCERCLLERSPLPIVWLITPAIFFAVWFGATYYIVGIGHFCLHLCQLIFLWISVGTVGSLIIYKFIAWLRERRP